MSTVRASSLFVLCCAIAVAGPIACGVSDPTWPDAGGADATTPKDGGATDAGAVDAGETDAGSVDAGPVDGGDTDGGTVDGGDSDGGIPVLGPFTIKLTSPTPTEGDTAVFTVTDCGSAKAVLINEGAIPEAGDSAWQACAIPAGAMSTDITYQLATGGLHELHVWIRNANNEILDAPPKVDVVRGSMFAMGDEHSCSLVQGRVQCWGDNTYGQLGNGLVDSSPLPVVVTGLDSGVQELSATSHGAHTCALKNGNVYCWGKNDQGQLGNPTVTTACNVTRPEPCSSSLVQVLDVNGQPLTNVISLTSGASASCALLADHSVYCWGDNSFSELGLTSPGFTVGAAMLATGFPSTGKIAQLSMGVATTCGLTATGWQCAGLDYTNSPPTDFGPNSALLGAGGDTSCRYGYQCRAEAVAPAALSSFTNVDVVSIGFYHACALADGQAVCWGANHLGQYGNGSMQPVAGGATVPLTAKADFVISGAHHSCARLEDGTVSCWGLNDFGQLGAMSTEQCSAANFPCSTKPVAVAGLTDVASMAAGRRQTCAAAHGHVYCWGGNDANELGGTGAENCPDTQGHPQLCSHAPVEVVGVNVE